MSPTRAAALAEARSWLATPYRHQASAKGQGADCLGLVRGVWRALYGAEPERPPPYPPDWHARTGEETLLAAARRRLVERDHPRPGDVLLFRRGPGRPAAHCAILSRPWGPEAAMIHAYPGRGVAETGCTRWWRARLAGVFAFPDIAP